MTMRGVSWRSSPIRSSSVACCVEANVASSDETAVVVADSIARARCTRRRCVRADIRPSVTTDLQMQLHKVRMEAQQPAPAIGLALPRTTKAIMR